MGLITTDITLNNPMNDKSHSASALVDTGALHLCIPEHVAREMGLQVYEQKTVTLADGSTKKVDYVGAIVINCLNRVGITGACVVGDEILLGAIPIAATIAKGNK